MAAPRRAVTVRCSGFLYYLGWVRESGKVMADVSENLISKGFSPGLKGTFLLLAARVHVFCLEQSAGSVSRRVRLQGTKALKGVEI